MELPSTPLKQIDRAAAVLPVTPATPLSTTDAVARPRHLRQGTSSVFGQKADWAAHEEEQSKFGQNREALVQSLDDATTLVSEFQQFNDSKYALHYSRQLDHDAGQAGPSSKGSMSMPSTPVNSVRAVREASKLRRSQSVFGSEELAARPSPVRSSTSLSTAGSEDSDETLVAEKEEKEGHPLSILSLDEIKDRHGASQSLPQLVQSFGAATLAQLLSRRLTTSLSTLSSLRSRVIDTQSRILVTGDLNAGKSTFVNALLRREVMPSDQQPCTSTFCEVLDAELYNGGVEELHAIRSVEAYNAHDDSTFERFTLAEVQDVQDQEGFELLKAYVTDNRAPFAQDTAPEENPSFIRNGLVSISLIDAPGLNKDTLSTTSVFAKEAEIDVIVFVVSAENHFTLSGREFLFQAAQSKAYVFVVVNKWNAIKDKTRCQRIVGDQIKQLSPATWESRNELVHFVDASDNIDAPELDDEPAEEGSFGHLEQSLRSFVLLKRSRTKLQPAKNYLLHLLSDIGTLIDVNVAHAAQELADAQAELEEVKPVHERLLKQKSEVDDAVDKLEEVTVESISRKTWTRLDSALAQVAKGDIATPAKTTMSSPLMPGVEALAAPTELPAYPGILDLWPWLAEVQKTLVRSLEAAVRGTEDEARAETAAGVNTIMNDLSEKYLSSSTVPAEGRVFRPEVMFAKRRMGIGRFAARGNVAGLGLGAAGSINSWAPREVEVSVLDLVDFERIFGHFRTDSGKKEEEEGSDTALTTVSLGVGAATMFGSRALLNSNLLDSLANIAQALGSEKARKWVGPVVGVVTVGLAVYVVIDLPRAARRNIGRKIALSLSPSTSDGRPGTTFSSAHSDRVSRESRKVLRLAGWDLREKHRQELDESAKARKAVEEVLQKSGEAQTWLKETKEKVGKKQKVIGAIAV